MALFGSLAFFSYFCNEIYNPYMKKTTRHFIGAIALTAVCGACGSSWHMTGIERTRLVVDDKYDAYLNTEANEWLKPYKQKVDSVMSPVVGQIAHDMRAKKPESDLSNLLCDILVWEGQRRGENPDFAVYNMGGMRAAFSKGDVTYGDVLAVAPFENKICFLTLTGEKTLELFQQIASEKGEGLSHGVEMVMTKDYKLKSVKLHGKEIDPNATYRIATIDYLAQGNGGMLAFKSATNLVSPQDKANNARFIIVDYFKAAMAQGKTVDSKVEGRLVIE